MANLWHFIIGDAVSATGFSSPQLEAIYSKYGGQNSVIRTRKFLFEVLFFSKNYSKCRADAIRTNRSSYGHVYTKIRRGIFYLAGVVDELRFVWRRKWHTRNDIPDDAFDQSFRLLLDAFPIYIQRPSIFSETLGFQ